MFSIVMPRQTAVYPAHERDVTLDVPTKVGGLQARQLVAQAQAAIRQDMRCLVLDVRKTADIGTHGLMALKAVNSLLRQEQHISGCVRLLNARPSLLRVLRGYGFSEYTLIYSDC